MNSSVGPDGLARPERRAYQRDFSAFFPASLPAERRTYQRDLTAASVKLTPALPLSGFSASSGLAPDRSGAHGSATFDHVPGLRRLGKRITIRDYATARDSLWRRVPGLPLADDFRWRSVTPIAPGRSPC